MNWKKLTTALQPNAKCYDISISTISRENIHHDVSKEQEPWFKCRYVVAMIGFTLFFFLTFYRMNIGVGIVSMVKNPTLSNQSNINSTSCPIPFANFTNEAIDSATEYQVTGEFDWSPKIQGYIHGSYSLSYMISQIPLGKLIERYGCKWFVFWGTLVAAVATLLIPIASRMHPYVLIFMQILRGLGHGVYQSACSLFVSNWFPRMERGLLYTFIQSGSALGGFLGSLFSGLLCKSSLFGGWPSSFYLYGIAGLILAASIAHFLYESPSVHPRISDAELNYILTNQENVLTQRRPDTPWKEIFSSVPIYSLAVAYFGQAWGFSQLIIVHSTFLGTILHYPIDENGFLSALPFLLMFLFAIISSWLSGFLTKREYASVDRVRKSCNFIACLGYSLCFLGVCLSGCNKTWSSTFSILSLAFCGIGFSGSPIVSTDMSPTFAATINSVCMTFGFLPSFILPLIVGYLTNEEQTLEQWNKVFFIGIGVVMTSGLVFSIFGSAEVQPWNFVEENLKKKEDEDLRY